MVDWYVYSSLVWLKGPGTNSREIGSDLGGG
jgi:hypothetical protein